MNKIIEKQQLNENTFSFWINSPEIAKSAKPGQFLHIAVGGAQILRCPISICDLLGENVRFVMSVVGESTKILSEKRIGDELDILGPLGRGFDAEKEGNALLIGGGIGIFPLLLLSKQLLKRGDYVQAILGFRNKDLALMYEQFPNVSLVTDDGSLGTKGLVTDIASDIIRTQQIDKIYACGPKPMLKAVSNLADKEDIWCQVSMEEKMACGIGICRACVCKTSAGSQTTICKNGPVFNSKELAWS